MEDNEILEEIKRLKQQIKDLSDQIIDFELPKNYNEMTDDEKKAYHQKQDRLKKEALKDMNNYSVVNENHTVVTYLKNRHLAMDFVGSIGRFLTTIPLERTTFSRSVSDNVKQLHKNNLDEIEKQIDRFNSTKAVRNDRIEFGVNFNNFIESYFNKLACVQLDKYANKVFLKFFEKSHDKNGDVIDENFRFQNLTDDQRKELIKIRIKLFSNKLNTLQKVAEAKVKKDSLRNRKTFLEEHGISFGSMAYRNASKKFTTSKSVISGSGIDMAKSKQNKKDKSQIISKMETQDNRLKKSQNDLIEINIMREKFEEFSRNYKGNGRQFSVEFQQNFPKIAEKLYKQKTKDNSISFRSQNLESSPISVQQHEIEKQFNEELRKIDYRMRMNAYFIPVSESSAIEFLGKNLTNAKTKTERGLDNIKIRELERDLNNVDLRKDLVSFDIIVDALGKVVKSDFEKYFEQNKNKFEKMTDKAKSEELKRFISKKIEKLKQNVHKNKFFSLGSEKLEKLNGILINRQEKIENKEIRNIFESLNEEQTELYKHILQSVKELTSKYNTEKNAIDKLSEKLEELNSKPYSYEINNQIQNVIKEMSSHNKKLALVKKSLETEKQRKKLFESNYAEKQIDKAISSNIVKYVSYNNSKSVFDRYSFPAIDAFGETYLIEKSSIEGKQVEKIIALFIMNFKNQIQNMKLAFAGCSVSQITEFVGKLEENGDDDFGSNIRDLKKTQKFFSEQIKALQENANSMPKDVCAQMQNFLQRLLKIENDLVKKLKSMNIEIGDVKLAKK